MRCLKFNSTFEVHPHFSNGKNRKFLYSINFFEYSALVFFVWYFEAESPAGGFEKSGGRNPRSNLFTDFWLSRPVNIQTQRRTLMLFLLKTSALFEGCLMGNWTMNWTRNWTMYSWKKVSFNAQQNQNFSSDIFRNILGKTVLQKL